MLRSSKLGSGLGQREEVGVGLGRLDQAENRVPSFWACRPWTGVEWVRVT